MPAVPSTRDGTSRGFESVCANRTDMEDTRKASICSQFDDDEFFSQDEGEESERASVASKSRRKVSSRPLGNKSNVNKNESTPTSKGNRTSSSMNGGEANVGEKTNSMPAQQTEKSVDNKKFAAGNTMSTVADSCDLNTTMCSSPTTGSKKLSHTSSTSKNVAEVIKEETEYEKEQHSRSRRASTNHAPNAEDPVGKPSSNLTAREVRTSSKGSETPSRVRTVSNENSTPECISVEAAAASWSQRKRGGPAKEGEKNGDRSKSPCHYCERHYPQNCYAHTTKMCYHLNKNGKQVSDPILEEQEFPCAFCIKRYPTNAEQHSTEMCFHLNRNQKTLADAGRRAQLRAGEFKRSGEEDFYRNNRYDERDNNYRRDNGDRRGFYDDRMRYDNYSRNRFDDRQGFYPEERRFYEERRAAPQNFDRRYEDPRYTDRRGAPPARDNYFPPQEYDRYGRREQQQQQHPRDVYPRDEHRFARSKDDVSQISSNTTTPLSSPDKRKNDEPAPTSLKARLAEVAARKKAEREAQANAMKQALGTAVDTEEKKDLKTSSSPSFASMVAPTGRSNSEVTTQNGFYVNSSKSTPNAFRKNSNGESAAEEREEERKRIEAQKAKEQRWAQEGQFWARAAAAAARDNDKDTVVRTGAARGDNNAHQKYTPYKGQGKGHHSRRAAPEEHHREYYSRHNAGSPTGANSYPRAKNMNVGTGCPSKGDMQTAWENYSRWFWGQQANQQVEKMSYMNLQREMERLGMLDGAAAAAASAAGGEFPFDFPPPKHAPMVPSESTANNTATSAAQHYYAPTTGEDPMAAHHQNSLFAEHAIFQGAETATSAVPASSSNAADNAAYEHYRLFATSGSGRSSSSELVAATSATAAHASGHMGLANALVGGGAGLSRGGMDYDAEAEAKHAAWRAHHAAGAAHLGA